MEQIGSKIKQNLSHAFKAIGQYICWFIANANQKLKHLLGDQNYRLISQFLDKHAFACIFGSMVVAASVFHFRYRKKMINQPVVSSDHSKSKRSTSQKLPDKLKNKLKFASDDDDDQIGRSQNLTTEHYESTLQSKKQRRKTVPKKKREKEEDFEQTLNKQVDKAKQKKLVLDDSKSDKIFNQMYGMYQQALR